MEKYKFYFLGLIAGMVLTFAHCNNDDEDNPEDTGPDVNITAEFYFYAEIDGETILFQDGIGYYGNGCGSHGGGATNLEEQSMLFKNPLDSANWGGISILKQFTTSPTSCDILNTMFQIGSYPFGNPEYADQSGNEGATVFYIDENGKCWDTHYGSGDQSGSNFEIIQHYDGENTGYYGEMVTKATFNCTLYDEDGNTKVLENGEIKSRSLLCNHL